MPDNTEPNRDREGAVETSENQPSADPKVDPSSSPEEVNQTDVEVLKAVAGQSDAAVDARSSGGQEEDVDAAGHPTPDPANQTPGATGKEPGLSSASEPEWSPGSSPLGSQPFAFPAFSKSPAADVDPARVTMLNDVNLGVRIELGRARMLVEDVLRLDEGSVVELDRLAGDPVDVFANDRLIARGEVLVLNDCFCVRISEVFSHDPHRVIQ